jgi:hypothetical protein
MCGTERTFDWCSKGQLVDSEWQSVERGDKRHREQKATCFYAKLQTIYPGKVHNTQKIQMFIIQHFEKPNTSKKKNLYIANQPLHLYTSKIVPVHDFKVCGGEWYSSTHS